MHDGESTPGMEPTDFGPLNEREVSVVLMESTEGKETWYAKMLDRFHEIYQLELSLKKEGADNSEIKPINDDRDRLHKQLERLGKALGKNKDQVLADVMAREGNLGEYLLPEYGVITSSQLEPDYVKGFRNDDLRHGRFLRTQNSEEVLVQDRAYPPHHYDEKQVSEIAAQEEGLLYEIPGLGKRKTCYTLAPHEAAIIFGTTFTVDIGQDPVEIQPPGFPERFRRAAHAVDALVRAGVETKIFHHTSGAYHDTTTLVGMIVPVDHIQDEVVGLLRNHRDLYGVRPEDLDPRQVQKDYQGHLDSMKVDSETISALDVIRIVLKDLPSELENYQLPDYDLVMMWQEIDGKEEQLGHRVTAEEVVKMIYQKFPLLSAGSIEDLIKRDTDQRVSVKKRHLREFLSRHQHFFGKKKSV